MAINEAKTVRILDALFTQLAEPFGPSEIKWRVTHTSHDGTRGAVTRALHSEGELGGGSRLWRFGCRLSQLPLFQNSFPVDA